MDIFSQVIDPLPSESSSSSEEGILLATSRPKKRAGRRVFKETRHPIFRGIRRRNNNKWVCELREPNKKTRIWLGTYPDPEMAARAHDVAALALRGKSACLNFADSTWRLPVPASADAKDIRKAAAEAAEAFRPRDDVKLSEEEVSMAEEKVFYMDEEAVFDMPGLLVNMAEGLLLSPPPLLLGDDDMKWGDCYQQSDGSVSLWSHSIDWIYL